MAREVVAGSVPDRILRLLSERYPAKLADVALALALRDDTVRLEVRRLAAQGLVVVESPGGVEYVALTGAGWRRFGGRLKRGEPATAASRDDNDPAFG